MGVLDSRTDRYLALGALSAVVSFFLLPIAGLVSIYSSYRVYDDVPAVYSYLIAGVGAVSIVSWLLYLLLV